MTAQLQTQVLYRFPTREEIKERDREKVNRGERDLFERRQYWWDRRTERQNLWLAAQQFCGSELANSRLVSWKEWLKKKRDGKHPCTLDPVTFEEGHDWEVRMEAIKKLVTTAAPEDAQALQAIGGSVSADAIEEFFDCKGIVQGSRTDRSRFWDFVELIANDITPADLYTIHNTSAQLEREKEEILVWQQRWKLSVNDPKLDSEPEWANARAELTQILTGHTRGIQFYSPSAQKNLRRYASLYIKAGHGRQEMCEPILSKPFGRMWLDTSFTTAATGQFGLDLENWQTWGIEQLAQLPPSSWLRAGHTERKAKLPTKPIALMISQDQDFKLQRMQVFGIALGVWSTWPPAFVSALAVMDERLYGARQAYYDTNRQKKGDTSRPIRVELNEQELFGQTITEGLPVHREMFWHTLYSVSQGQTSYRSWSSVQNPRVKENNQHCREMACRLIVAGHSPFALCTPVAYGAAGVRLIEEDSGIFPRLQLRYVADSGLDMF